MRILFLGAGASVDANYPITSDLLNIFERNFESSDFINDRNDWLAFDTFRKEGPDIFKSILHSSNPEVILSQIDLLTVTRSEAEAQWLKNFSKAMKGGNPQEIDAVNKQLENPILDFLSKGQIAKASIFRLINKFFSLLHCKNNEDGGKGREYLHRAMRLLGEGDFVIGTNWDTLSERTLMEQEKWNPSDGYGFQVPILYDSKTQPAQALRQQSLVKVFKLHGSIGWHREDDDEDAPLYLSHALYLKYFTMPQYPNIRDRNAPPPGSGDDRNPVTIYPSYLKQINDPIITDIWEQASQALLNADEVFIVGYSLPKADAAIRALLIPLRARLNKNTVKVTVVNKSKENVEEWKKFLGSKISTVAKRASDFF